MRLVRSPTSDGAPMAAAAAAAATVTAAVGDAGAWLIRKRWLKVA